jgi:hypothetical protein
MRTVPGVAPPHAPYCSVSRRFGNWGHSFLGPRNSRYVVTDHCPMGTAKRHIPSPTSCAPAPPHWINLGTIPLVKSMLPLRNHQAQTSKMLHRKRILAPPAGSQPLPRWAGGHYRYPTDRVHPHTSSKSRQRAGLASTHLQMARSSDPAS